MRLKYNTLYNDKLHNVVRFFDNFKASYKSTITRARGHLYRLKGDQHRLRAIALLTQISSAWHSFDKLDQNLDELDELVHYHETAGDFITAVVLQEHVLSKFPPNTSNPAAEAAWEKFLGLYNMLMNLVVSIAPRLDLDVDICISIAPILRRVLRLNNSQFFNAFLLRGADLASEDYLCRTVVHVAAQYHTIHVLMEFSQNLLREAHCDLFKRSPLLLAVESNSIIAVRHLLRLPARHTEEATVRDLLTAAVRAGLVDMVRLLLIESNLSTARKRIQDFGLNLAASKGHVDIVRLFLIAGAVLNDIETSIDSSSRAMTALCYAAEAGHLEVVRHLLKLKADVSARSGDLGMAPLHAAAENGRCNIIPMLL